MSHTMSLGRRARPCVPPGLGVPPMWVFIWSQMDFSGSRSDFWVTIVLNFSRGMGNLAGTKSGHRIDGET